MTETVLLERAEAARLFEHESTRPLRTRVPGHGPRCAGEGQCGSRPRALGRRDRLPGEELRGVETRSMTIAKETISGVAPETMNGLSIFGSAMRIPLRLVLLCRLTRIPVLC